MFTIVETPAMDSAALEKYRRHGGSALSVLNRFFVAKNSSVHGIRNKTPVATYIPPDCSNCTDNSNSRPPKAEVYARFLVGRTQIRQYDSVASHPDLSNPIFPSHLTSCEMGRKNWVASVGMTGV